jgi:hypothetical protein
MGSCDWLPTPGDLCLRVEDAGDCFHTYIALRKTKDGKYKRAGKFGAYVFGEAICTLDERTFHLACAGEPVRLELKKKSKKSKKRKK